MALECDQRCLLFFGCTYKAIVCEWKGRDLNSLKDKTIFIEEFSMVPNK